MVLYKMNNNENRLVYAAKKGAGYEKKGIVHTDLFLDPALCYYRLIMLVF